MFCLFIVYFGGWLLSFGLFWIGYGFISFVSFAFVVFCLLYAVLFYLSLIAWADTLCLLLMALLCVLVGC